jgi:membrane-bound lytic murein transglycosylase MltF
MGQAHACERPCTPESEDTSQELELQELIEADILAVEQLKRTKFPVLDWQNSKSVEVHTLLATLYNSRFVAPVKATLAANIRWV